MVSLSVLWLLVLGAPDLYAHLPYLRGANTAERFAYLALWLASWSLFVGVMAALLRLRQRHGKTALVFGALYGLWIGVAVALAIPYRVRFGQDLPASYLSFWLQNRSYGWKLFRLETSLLVRTAMAGCIVLVTFCITGFTWLRHTSQTHVRRSQLLLLTGLVLMGVSVFRKRASLPADFHEARVAVATLTLLSDPGRLPTPKRPQLTPRAAAYRPNVVFLLGESLSAEEYSPWSGNQESPGLGPFLREHGDGFVAMLKANATASATDISVPAILTGLRSDNGAQEFARAPLLWHEARARGYVTGLFSSQDYSWLHLGEFLLGADKPDVVRVMADFPGAPQVNDGAIDDALAVDAALAYLDTVPAEQPFFVVVHFNATHFPSWAPGLEPVRRELQDLMRAPVLGRRQKSLAYMESLQRRILDHLLARGLYEQTVLLVTSDHGVGSRDNAPSRLESHYEDVLRVPMGIHLPAAFRAARSEAAAQLAQNATARTSNVDLFPTMLDIWGAAPDPNDGRPALRGSSLLRALPDRWLLAMSSGPVRGWHRHGFALYHGDVKWSDDDHEGLRVFDLERDPGERHDVFLDTSMSERASFVQQVRASQPLVHVLEGTNPELLAH